ncbi:MAG: tetratricopeptide repeat protein [Deltaproteobacteria bacterium]|nr:tetratricopeptide repeat protein [Deltaproteobacteria bacterium]
MSQETSKILVVIGDPSFSGVVNVALQHPSMQVESAEGEQNIVNALTTEQYDAVIVGGKIGRRGPLVLCDVVRIRQTHATVLVLLRDETDDAQYKEHCSRNLDRVKYLDLRNVPVGFEQGLKIRSETLELLQIEEEVKSAALWPQQLVAPADLAQQPKSKITKERNDYNEDNYNEDSETAENAIFDKPLTEDDLAFAARLAVRTRGVDFRSPMQASQAPEGTDRATAKLRDRVRELERQLAYLAFVYAKRLQEFEGSEYRIEQAESKNNAFEQELSRLQNESEQETERLQNQTNTLIEKLEEQTHRAEIAQKKLQESAVEIERLREDIRTKEAGFINTLKQAQEAFAQIREQSNQTLALHERRTNELEEKLHTIEQELSETRNAKERAILRLTELTSELESRAQLVGELNVTKDNLATQIQVVEQLQNRISTLEGELLSARNDIIERTRREVELIENNNQERDAILAEKVAAIARSEQRCEKLESNLESINLTITDREREVATLAARLDASDNEVRKLSEAVDTREKELVRIRKVESDLRNELERTKVRGIESALDARLVAIEEHARLAAEATSRQSDYWASFEQRSTKQALLTDRLLRIIEPSDNSASNNKESPEIAAQRLVESMYPNSVSKGRRHRFRQRPWLLLLFGLIIVAIIGTVIGFAWFKFANDTRNSVSDAKLENASEASGASENSETLIVRATTTKADESTLTNKKNGTASDKKGASSPQKNGDNQEQQNNKPTDDKKDNSNQITNEKKDRQNNKDNKEKNKDKKIKDDSAAKEKTELSITLSDDERKELRRELFSAYKAKKWSNAIKAGQRLQASGKIDWEAQLKLARAYRSADKNAEAIDAFKKFLENYPDNKYADEAKKTIEKLTKK